MLEPDRTEGNQSQAVKHSGASLVMSRPGKGAVVLVGNFRPAVTAIRELAKVGRKVFLISEQGKSCADASRFLDRTFYLPAQMNVEDGLRRLLPELLEQYPEIDCILPLEEVSINAIAALRSMLEGRVFIASAAAATVSLCHDKFEWLKLVDRLGLSCPPYRVAYDLESLQEAVSDIGFPIVVRPIESGKRIENRKAVTLSTEKDVQHRFSAYPEGLNGLLLQKKVEGVRHNIFFAADHGDILCEQYSLSFRTDRADGSGSTTGSRTIASNPEMSRQLAVVVRELGYHGIGCAQFLGDDEGNATTFLEINPRFGATYVVVEKAGMQFTRLTCELADPRCEVDWARAWKPNTGTTAVWASGDLSGLIYSIRQRDIGLGAALAWFAGTLRLSLTADTHSMWSWRDPMPAMSFVVGKVFRGVWDRLPYLNRPIAEAKRQSLWQK